jgi:hypothetical protein
MDPSMAVGHTRVLVVAQDASEVGNLVFKLNLRHLFSSQQPEADEILSLPDPFACFKQIDKIESMAFAASASGNVIIAVSTAGYGGRTLIYDAVSGSVSPGPDMCSVKQILFLVPVGDNLFFGMSARSCIDYPKGLPWFECLQQLCPGRWAWTPVQDPPGLPHGKRGDVRSYFVAGSHVWVTLEQQGTHSFDTARRLWRNEGEWEMPFDGRAVLVPDFLGTGRRLLFGMSYCKRRRSFCAVDMDATPPVTLKSWPEAWPTNAWAAGYVNCPFPPELTYFGGGRFSIKVINRTNGPVRSSVISFMAVELTPELQLIKHRSCSYLMPPSSRGDPAFVI